MRVPAKVEGQVREALQQERELRGRDYHLIPEEQAAVLAWRVKNGVPSDARGGSRWFRAMAVESASPLAARPSKGALECYFAVCEIDAERTGCRAGGKQGGPGFTVWQIRQRVGKDVGYVEAGLAELQALGIMRWSETHVVFCKADEAILPEHREAFELFRAEIRREGRRIPCPRAVLRSFSHRATHSFVLAWIAISARCSYGQAGGVNITGSMLASWFTKWFGPSRGAWKRALQFFRRQGWIRSEQYVCDAVRAERGQILHVVALLPDGEAVDRGSSPTGSKKTDPVNENQNDSPKENRSKRPEHNTQRTPSTRPAGHSGRPKGGKGAAPALSSGPLVTDVQAQDLRDLQRLRALYQQALTRGWMTPNGRSWVEFVAAACHALRVGKDKGALFAANLRANRWNYSTGQGGDLDEAKALVYNENRGSSTGPQSLGELIPGLGIEGAGDRAVRPTLLSEPLGGQGTVAIPGASGAPPRAAGAEAPRVRDVPELAQQLRAVIGAATYESWFRDLCAAEVNPGAWSIQLPDEFSRRWISMHYGAELGALLTAGVIRWE